MDIKVAENEVVRIETNEGRSDLVGTFIYTYI